MRIEKNQNNIYQKKPDKIDAYVLRVVQRYFENNEEAVNGSREDIINEAIRRVKPEVTNAIQHIVIEETKKYVKDELGLAIDTKLEHIIDALYEELHKIKDSQISKESYTATIEAPTYEVALPNSVSISSTRDIVNVYVNGLMSLDHTLVNGENGFVKKISFEPDILQVGDVIHVNCIILQ